MANHKGSEGVVKVGSVAVAEVRSFSVSESANLINDSTLGDTWETNKPGRSSWDGSIECWWDETDTTGQGALTIGAEVTLNLYPEGDTIGDKYYTGSAIITGIQRQNNDDGMVTAMFSFKGNGALTLSTAA